MPVKVLYEDNHLIAVYKPAGIPVQGDSSGDESLFDMVKDYLKTTYRKTGNVFLGLIHRLDRPVGGIVLFAKTSKGAARLSEQFRVHSITKEYYALVKGIPLPAEKTLVHFLLKDEARNTVRVFERAVPGAVRAELAYRVVNNSQGYALVRIDLLTGRSHQIRAQLAAIGCPIVGDVKYGGPLWKDSPRAIALQASSLRFETATTAEMKSIDLPVPPAWLNPVDIMA